MQNSYAGDFPIDIAGEQKTLRFNYAALARMRTEYSKDVLQTLFADLDPDVIAGVIAIGLQHHHPEITKQDVFEASPILWPAFHSIDKAFAYAYFGADGVKESEASPPDVKKNPKSNPAMTKKKTILQRIFAPRAS